jgi:Carboxypeptidase regulatory-like domain
MTWSRLAVGLLLSASAAFAQGALGTITGTITDPNGELVAGVSVRARNMATGTVYTVDSLRTGGFTLSQLPAGSYELSIPRIGFRFLRYTQKDIAVQSGRTVRVDVRLQWQNDGALGDDTYLLLHNKYERVSGPAPRTAAGKPDFSGTWNSPDPDPDPPQTLPWATAVVEERRRNNFKDSPTAACLPRDVVPASPFVYKIVQTPSLLLQIWERPPYYRQVFLDGRAHPADVTPTWMGHSIGKWEGDTLVIDSVGFHEKSWLPNAVPHTERLRVVERYRRPDLGHLQIEVTFEDPGTFTKSWQMRLVWELVPGEELMEYLCENNRFPEVIGGR